MDDELYQRMLLQKAIRDKEFPGCLWVFFNHETRNGDNLVIIDASDETGIM